MLSMLIADHLLLGTIVCTSPKVGNKMKFLYLLLDGGMS